jgi:hypothetical protein
MATTAMTMTLQSAIRPARASLEGARANAKRFDWVTLGALTLALCLLAIAPAAQAAPSHPHEPARDIAGLDHACGAAVDSQGDVYASSAGEGKVKVFDPEHNELKAIANANEPCGLAVDSKGNLYVSEKKTGNVVRYQPNTYPFAGTPSYSAAEPIDSSGKAKGISVDVSEDRLYVAEGDRIVTYDSAGAPGPTVGLGELGNATGVGVYTYASAPGHYVFATDDETDQVKVFSGKEVAALKLRRTIDGVDQDRDPKTPDQEFGFGSAGSAVGVDWVSGHFFVYDAAHSAVDEFEASGEFLDQFSEPGLTDAEPTAVAAFPQRNEIQKVRVIASGGTFALSFEGESTLPLPFDVEATQIQVALEALSSIGAGNVSVHGHYTQALQTGLYFVAFAGALGIEDVAQLVGDGSALSGANHDLAVKTEAEGMGPGQVYVTAGSGAGAKLAAFAPLAAPSRPSLPGLSHLLPGSGSVAVDSVGDVYVAAGSAVHVYGPDGQEIEVGPAGEGFTLEKPTVDLAVDSTGKVYTLFSKDGEQSGLNDKVQYYTPAAYPPVNGTQYSTAVTAATGKSFSNAPGFVSAIGLDPADDHVFVGSFNGQVIELGSAAEGSPVLTPCFACNLGLTGLVEDIEAYGANGDVYISRFGNGIQVADATGTENLAQIGGAGAPAGPLLDASSSVGKIGVDQADGHVIVFDAKRGAAEEFEASGAFVAGFGGLEVNTFPAKLGVAIDNSGGPSNGNVYVAFDQIAPETPDLTAFGPLAYGEAPVAMSGIADGLGGGDATLHGTVDPRGFELEDCHFEYLSAAEYETNGKTFAGALSVPCVESFGEIGKGTGAVEVHAAISGLDPEGRYRFRLVAENKYGPSEGDAGLFGAPVLTTKSALPILYDEATLRAGLDPSGLATKYRFEYGTSEAYGQSTPTAELPPGDGPVAIEVPLTGLAEGTEYHFRLVAENEANAVQSPDQVLVTLARRPAESCPNPEFRIGASANLPDCRAYELVTPAETLGALGATAAGSAGEEFNNWLVVPRGPGAGERLSYFYTTFPGVEGSGTIDGYHAQRGEGAHPAGGWSSEIFSPSYAQIGRDGGATQHGVAADQRYAFFSHGGVSEAFPQTLPSGELLRTPAGFEVLGQGSLGTDPNADSKFLSASGAHAIYSSTAHLEEEAAPTGTGAIYDRAAGAPSSAVVSVRPDGSPFGAGEDASYVAAGEDGSAVLFTVGGTLYVHREGATTEVAAAPNVFAGISEDGKRVFYTAGSSGEAPAGLFSCDVQAGSCAGPEALKPTEIAPNSIFVNISPDGSHVFFTSKEAFTGAEENEAGEVAETGEDNLYAWDGASTRFVAILDPQDFIGFGESIINLGRWTSALSAGPQIGRNHSPTRSTPEGTVFLFQSHAKLTAYDNEGTGEIYRYDPSSAPGEKLLCISCDPTGAPPGGEGQLRDNHGPAFLSTLLTNVTDDGGSVFFESPDRLLPEDANSALDVYEWRAPGVGSCKRAGGCLALISTGQGEGDSFLYGMSADGHDVIFFTPEKLVGQDIPASPSLYDARVDGGIPFPPEKAACEGDACQGTGSTPPVISSPASATIRSQGNTSGEKAETRCTKNQRKSKRSGKTRCVAKHHKRRQHERHRANRNRRTHR